MRALLKSSVVAPILFRCRKKMPTRQELKGLANVRLREAEILYDAGMYDGASYLSGYVIELALKARICKILNVKDYPSYGPYKTVYAVHNFDQLRFLAGLDGKVTLVGTPKLFDNWSMAAPWGPERRYAPVGTCSRQNANNILDAIRERPDGVLTWIKRHW